MTRTLWDTTGTEVVKALSAERRAAGSVSSGLALTLVVVTDEPSVAEAEQAATHAAAQHPCRLLVVVRRRPDAPESRLDAEVLIGDRLGPGEAVVMRMYGRLALHAESVVLPLLAPDAPVVTWWHREPPHLIAHDPLGVSADRRVTDCAEAPDPVQALHRRAEDYVPGDTDLGWARATLWRSVVASAFDGVEGTVRSARIVAGPAHPTAMLLRGWMTQRLGVEPELVEESGERIGEVSIEVDTGSGSPLTVAVHRVDSSSARVSRSDRPDRIMPLPRRYVGDLLAEELRRLDADEPYAEALAAATGVDTPLHPPAGRTHIWQDPAEAPSDPAITTA